MGGYDLGNVHGRIILDASGITSGINSARQALNSGFSNMGQSLQSFGDQITGVGARLSALSAPAIVFGASGLNVAADFDALLTQIELFGGVTGEELNAVREYALELGRDTIFTSQDAGGALLDLLKSGQDLEQALTTLPEVLNLAAVGEISLSHASGIASGSLAMFQMEAEHAGRVVDALAQAANASRADVAGLGEGLSNVGPIANTFGLDVQDTAAILAVFAQNNIMGAEAGTQLKSMLLNMSRPTNEVQEAYSALGVSLYDAQGNVRDFNEFILDLDSALDGLPVQEQNEMMQRLGGSYGILGLTALRASGGIGGMLDQMRDAPEAGALAEGFMDTFRGKVISLQGSIETFKIQTFTPFMNTVLADFVDRLISVVNRMSDWAQANPELTTTILRIGSVIAVAGPALMAMGLAVSNIGFAIRTVAPIIGLLTSPLGLIAGAGLALAHIFDIDLRQAFTDTIEAVVPILDNLRVWFVEDAMPAIVNFIQTTVLPTLRRIGMVIGEVWSRVAPVLGQLYEWFVTTALPAIAGLIETVLIPAIHGIGNIFREIYETVAPILSFLIDWFVTQAVPIIAGLLTDVIIPAIGVFISVLGAIWNAVAPALQTLIDWFQATGWPIIEGIINNVITPVINLLVGILKGIWEFVEPVINELVNWFNNVIAPAIDLAVTFVTVAVDAFILIFTGIWTGVQSAFTALENWFNNVIAPVINAAVEQYIRPAIQALVGVFLSIWEWARPGLEALQDGLESIFGWINTNVIQPILSALRAIPETVERARQALDLLNGNAAVVDQARSAVANSGASRDEVYRQAYNATRDQFGGGIFGELAATVLAPSITNSAMTAPSRDLGGEGLAMMPYLIGKPQEDNEIFVPRTSGTFIPNFMEKLDGFMALMDGQTQQQQPMVGQVIIHANDAEGGKKAGDAFVARIDQLIRAKG